MYLRSYPFVPSKKKTGQVDKVQNVFTPRFFLTKVDNERKIKQVDSFIFFPFLPHKSFVGE